jgi:hypothetical protein
MSLVPPRCSVAYRLGSSSLVPGLAPGCPVRQSRISVRLRYLGHSHLRHRVSPSIMDCSSRRRAPPPRPSDRAESGAARDSAAVHRPNAARAPLRATKTYETLPLHCKASHPLPDASQAESGLRAAARATGWRLARQSKAPCPARTDRPLRGITGRPRRRRSAPGRRDRHLRASHTSRARPSELASKHHSPRSCTYHRRSGRSY